MIQSRLPRWPDRDQVPALTSETAIVGPREFPVGVRLARPTDRFQLYDLARMAHRESGYGELDETTIQDIINRGCLGKGCVFAVIEGPGRIEATIGLRLEKRWYVTDAAENWHHQDILFFVHPDHRNSRHAAALFNFASWWEQETKMPVVLGVTFSSDAAARERLYSRIGRKIGALFLIDTHNKFPDKGTRG